MTSEVDRYCATPGQACGYKVGHTEILKLRAKVKARLGKAFDLADFNDQLLEAGPVPMDVLASRIEAYAQGHCEGRQKANALERREDFATPGFCLAQSLWRALEVLFELPAGTHQIG